jgi:methylglutaconyl-CoA hydratase
MLSAEAFDIATAEVIGLVHNRFFNVLGDDDIFATFSSNGLEAMKATKKLLNQIQTANWDEQKKLTTTVISERRISAEGQEKLKLFFDKK